MYKRTEDQAETAIIRRFMIDDRFRHRGLEKEAFAQILRGLKIQGVKKVIFMDYLKENADELCLSFGFHFIGMIDKSKYGYALYI